MIRKLENTLVNELSEQCRNAGGTGSGSEGIICPSTQISDRANIFILPQWILVNQRPYTLLLVINLSIKVTCLSSKNCRYSLACTTIDKKLLPD